MLSFSNGVVVAAALYKRGAISAVDFSPSTLIKRKLGEQPDAPQYELPSWSWAVLLADLIVLLPAIILMSYTFQHVFPVFAMVESETPPDYEPLPLPDDEAVNADAAAGPNPTNGPNKPAREDSRSSRAVSSSFRAINRLVYSDGGIRSYFRGLACLIAHGFATSILFVIFSAFLPTSLASITVLIASLALVQLSTAWVHIVITPRRRTHFWSRLPPFRRTFDATARPVAIYWLALQVANFAPLFLAYILGLPLPDMNAEPGKPSTVPAYEASAAWKGLVIFIVSVFISLFLVLPSHIVLVRVQASLLPESEDPLVNFDRSFGGSVVPAVVGGKGYVTMTDAWRTFSLSAWRRIIILYVKLFFVNMAVLFGMAVVVVPGVYFMLKHSTRKE